MSATKELLEAAARAVVLQSLLRGDPGMSAPTKAELHRNAFVTQRVIARIPMREESRLWQLTIADIEWLIVAAIEEYRAWLMETDEGRRVES